MLGHIGRMLNITGAKNSGFAENIDYLARRDLESEVRRFCPMLFEDKANLF